MPDITDSQAVKFCNEKIRVAADKLAQAYAFANQVKAEWTAHGGAVLVPNTSDPVVDGSATDGRPPITGADANNIINRLTELKADYDADSAAKLNTILSVAVNTGA